MPDDSYGPLLGAHPTETGTRFALWTTKARACAVRIMEAGKAPRTLDLRAADDGIFELEVPGVGHGARYVFLLDGAEVRDPYATFLPDGVAPKGRGAVDAPAVVWRSGYRWKHAATPRPLGEHVFYELHVGTFTAEGTYAAATSRLADLVDLGVTAVELMPLNSFPGLRGWGYDGVAHYAPFAPYGNPDELRAFIDEAHGLGLSVFLDVVYNHFGPAGNVLHAYSPEYFTAKYTTPWGDPPNFEHAAMRRYVVRNVRYWLEEFRFDGLRIDAVHAISDESSCHIVAEIADEAAKLSPKRLLIGEDERNDPRFVDERKLDGLWADDFHHQVRVALTGERDGYYAAYSGTAADLAATIQRGWFYCGASYSVWGKPRGREPRGLPADAFIYCIQNHDQIGNRALGGRLTETISREAFAAATMLLLFLPMTPLLFMGQEWAASSPFLYFTDHDAELGRAVTEGRRKEFAHFAAFADEAMRAKIPDPQSTTTFERSKLDWSERTKPDHARLLAIYRAMLRLRASDPVLRQAQRQQLRAFADGDMLVIDRWQDKDVRRLVLNLGDSRTPPIPEGVVKAPEVLVASDAAAVWGAPMPQGSALLIRYEQSSST